MHPPATPSRPPFGFGAPQKSLATGPLPPLAVEHSLAPLSPRGSCPAPPQSPRSNAPSAQAYCVGRNPLNVLQLREHPVSSPVPNALKLILPDGPDAADFHWPFPGADWRRRSPFRPLHPPLPPGNPPAPQSRLPPSRIPGLKKLAPTLRRWIPRTDLAMDAAACPSGRHLDGGPHMSEQHLR